MIAEDLLQLQDTRPFVPFKVHLADGSSFTIAHPKRMMITPSMPILYYVNAEWPCHRVAVHQITQLVEKTVAEAPAGAVRG